ncbi:outer dense fiber protein 2-like [Megalops cyprinoides]|uniref:outer dense fiber protein 2-like n=1 Tax=Megalops cyprinoides TaxID=118141 RepID=UPI0018642409|nr:outer dense fiber protein 2-like [Megalops cyprinoides]
MIWSVTHSMKDEGSLSPVHVLVDEVTPVHVHVQRSRSLPSFSGQRNSKKSSITPKQADRICSVIQASDWGFGQEEAAAAQAAESRHPRGEHSNTSAERGTELSSEDASLSPVDGSRMQAEEEAQCSAGRDGTSWTGKRSLKHTDPNRRHTQLEQSRSSCEDFSPENRACLLSTLMDAERAASAAAVQLMSFKEALGDDLNDSRLTAVDDKRMSRQKNLLLEKLEVFKTVNKCVRQQLKEFQNQEASRLETDRYIDVLLKKLTFAETENLRLKRDLSEKEVRVEELAELRQKELEKMETAVHQAKTGESTRAHLQGQLRHKESENSRLSVQLRGLERTMAEQKLEIERLKCEIASCVEKGREEKEALKKATRAQKQRAERFEAAVEKLYDQLREKDVKVAEAQAEVEALKRQQEGAQEERAPLEAQITLLKTQISDVTEQLQKERDSVRTANEDLLQKVEKLNSENANLCLENAALKASVRDLEERVRSSAAELEDRAAVSQKHKDLAENYQIQVADLQKEVCELKACRDSLRKETETAREGKDAEMEKVRRQLEPRVEELQVHPGLLSAAERRLQDSAESLALAETTAAHRAQTAEHLQVKIDKQMEQLRSSLEMKNSLNEANAQLQLRIDSMQRRMEEVQLENRELIHRLSVQEEALQYSGRLVEQRSADCHTLTRQLETALTDVRQEVSRVRENAGARERLLQSKILELETERDRRAKELKLLKQSKESVEKHYEVRLKELQLSLDQSESHKRSIQNYVDFLKNSYATMFEEGFSSDLGLSSFLK